MTELIGKVAAWGLCALFALVVYGWPVAWAVDALTNHTEPTVSDSGAPALSGGCGLSAEDCEAVP